MRPGKRRRDSAGGVEEEGEQEDEQEAHGGHPGTGRGPPKPERDRCIGGSPLPTLLIILLCIEGCGKGVVLKLYKWSVEARRDCRGEGDTMATGSRTFRL